MGIDEEEARDLLKRARNDAEQAKLEIVALQSRVSALQKFIESLELLHPALAPGTPSNAATPDRLHLSPVPDVSQALGAMAKVAAIAMAPPQMSASHKPRATDVVRLVLTENPDTWFAGRDMIREFGARQVNATPTAIRLALKRLAEKGFAELQLAEDGGHLFRLHKESDIFDAVSEVSTS